MLERRRRLGLRARITVIYALGALMVASMMAVSTFALTQARLVGDAEDAAREQAYRNALDLRRRLQSIPAYLLDPSIPAPEPLSPERALDEPGEPGTDIDDEPAAEIEDDNQEAVRVEDVLESLGITTTTTPDTPGPTAETESGTGDTDTTDTDTIDTEPSDPIIAVLGALLYTDRVDSLLVLQQRDRSLAGVRQTDLPGSLRFLVENGTVAEQRFERNGTTRFAVGVPLVDTAGGQYYEITSLVALDDTLRLLQAILIGAALAASLAGAFLGWYSARRALQPLVDVSGAARSIARGRFDTRLDDQVDPDLEVLTASFNEMVDALQTRIERDSRFASDVSHELRSPLQTLSASVDVLERRQQEMSPTARHALQLLGQEIRRFERLVEDLLEISRLDVGAISPDLGPVFLAEFLRFVVARSRTPDVPIDPDPDHVHLVVHLDKRRLAQALSNLLDNASKYAGGATSVGFRRRGDRVEIFVEDLGPGVAPADRDRIFDRFTRAGADAGRRESSTGVGLGLSLVAEHIRLHAGRVSVTQRLDGRRGARFVVDLPIGEELDFDEDLAI